MSEANPLALIIPLALISVRTSPAIVRFSVKISPLVLISPLAEIYPTDAVVVDAISIPPTNEPVPLEFTLLFIWPVITKCSNEPVPEADISPLDEIYPNEPVAPVAFTPPWKEPVPLELTSPIDLTYPNEPVAPVATTPPWKDPVPLALTDPLISPLT